MSTILEQIHEYASNPIITVPVVIIIMWLFLQFLQRQNTKPNVNDVSNNMIKTSLFTGGIVFFVLYLNKHAFKYDEDMIVAPAHF